MKIALFAPYTIEEPYKGIIYIVARYMSHKNIPVLQLLCNGVFRTCLNDQDFFYKKSIFNCQRCTFNQIKAIKWAGIKTCCLTQYIKEDNVDVQEQDPNVIEKVNKHTRDKLYDNYRLMFKGTINFLKSEKPLLSVVPDLNDSLTLAYFESAKKIQHPVFKVRWDKERKSTTLVDESGGKVLKSDLYTDAVFNLRNKVNSWPIEVIKHLEDVTKFFGIKQERKPLKPFNDEQRVVF